MQRARLSELENRQCETSCLGKPAPPSLLVPRVEVLDRIVLHHGSRFAVNNWITG